MINQALAVRIECEQQLLIKDIDNELYEYDTELESITSVFWDLSKSFYDRNILFTLEVKDVVYITYHSELCIFLETFYDIVLFATNKEVKAYDLDFFEPGARYLLSFKRKDSDYYSLEFIDRDISDFRPVYTEGSFLDLNLMLVTFYYRVTFLTKKICPSITTNEMYNNWASVVESCWFRS